MDLALALAREARRRPRHRQRPGRRPLRRRRARPATAGGCCAATRSARCSPTTWCAAARQRHVRGVDRVVVAARHDRRGARRCRTPRPSPASSGSRRVDGPALRLRGGARLLRRPRPGARQGRHHGRAARRRAGRRASRREGRTLLDLLDDLAVEHGLHATDQLSVRVEDLSLIADAMARLREHPPAVLGGPCGRVAPRTWHRAADGLPPTDGLRYRLPTAPGSSSARQGTEPKLKCYLEVVVPVAGPRRADGAGVAARDRAAIERGRRRRLGLD